MRASDHVAERHNNFDLLRLLAAGSVIFSHAFLIAEGSLNREPFYVLTAGQCSLGVVGLFVFFTMSGFLVTQSYEATCAPLRYTAKRLLRVYPGYVACLLALALLLGPAVTSLPLADYFGHRQFADFLFWNALMDTDQNGLPGVTFVDNPVGRIVDGPLWTLPCELLMYGLVLLLGIVRLLKLWLMLLLVAAGMACLWFDTAVNLLGSAGWLLGFFAAGMVLHRLRDTRIFDAQIALAALVGLVASVSLGQFILLFPLFGSYLIIWLARHPSLPVIPAARFGDFSYGLYIYGWPVEEAVTYFTGGRLGWAELFAVSLPITLAIAALSWHLVEKRALRLKPRSGAAASPGALPAAAPPAAP